MYQVRNDETIITRGYLIPLKQMEEVIVDSDPSLEQEMMKVKQPIVRFETVKLGYFLDICLSTKLRDAIADRNEPFNKWMANSAKLSAG